MVDRRYAVTRWLVPVLGAVIVGGLFVYWQLPPQHTPVDLDDRSTKPGLTSGGVVDLRAYREGGVVHIELDIRDHWHINANPASFDFLIPTEIKIVAGGIVMPVQINYPSGHALPVGFDRPIRVYSGQFFLTALAKKPIFESPVVEARVQACNDTGRCLAPATLSSNADRVSK